MTRVLVCGLAVVDFVFSLPQMPTLPEKYRADDVTTVGGGGGANAAVAVSRLGGEAALVARLGKDAIGQMILEGLREDGVDCAHARAFEGARSAFSSVLVDGAGERQIVNFRGDGFGDDASWLAPALEAPFAAALADTRWPEGARAVMAEARACGVPGVVDAEAPVDLQTVTLASHVAFSEQGLRDFTRLNDAEAGLRDAAGRLPGWLAVTIGSHGVLVAQDGQISHVPGFKVEAVDTLAAGDIWHGAFALALGEGQDEDAAVRFANAAAALKCRRLGGRTATPRRAEVAAFLALHGGADGA